jgi:V/A-type H+/Na+-transporting ATPase subunit E
MLMQNSQDRLNKFSSAVLNDAEKMRAKMQAELDEYKRKELDKAQDEYLTQSYELIQSEIQNVRNKWSREIAKRSLENRRELLMRRDEITQKVFLEAKQKIELFLQSEDYKIALIEHAKKVFDKYIDKLINKSVVIYLRSDDMKYNDAFKEVFKSLEVTISPKENITLGGFLFECRESNIIIDETYDSRFEEEKNNFLIQSGLTII